jgi:ABC-type transporter Mla MlaB component
VSALLNNETVVLTGNLVLTELSGKSFPDITSYQNVKSIDLQQLENIDSAGIAYIAQIKSHYPALRFVGISDKIHVLANLYGLSFLFKL